MSVLIKKIDIRDKLELHECSGFIPFYSTGITTTLNKKFISLKKNGVKIIEIYKDNILDIIPTMSGFTLQKYFPRPQDLYQHKNYEAEYKPLIFMAEGCNKDLLEEKNIHNSLASLCYDEKKINILYGCKDCVNKYLGNWESVELTQIRYIEQLLQWRAMIDAKFNSEYIPDEDFYECWALLQEAMTQILVPPGWGRWMPEGWDMSMIIVGKGVKAEWH